MQTTITVRTALIEDFRRSSIAAPQDVRVEGPTLTLTVDQSAEPWEVAEKAWTVGNRMARDAAGQAWPSNCRSMSEGDAVFFSLGSDPEVALVAAAFGFDSADRDIVGRNVITRRYMSDIGPWADASDVVEPGLTAQEAEAEYLAAL